MNRDDTNSRTPTASARGDAWQAAIEYGIDMSQVENLLSLAGARNRGVRPLGSIIPNSSSSGIRRCS
jgi:hypothetical protein